MNILKNTLHLILVFVSVFTITSCSDDDYGGNDDVTPDPSENFTVYTLRDVSDPDISGTATFTELDDDFVRVDLELQNTTDGGEHPAHIHINTAAEGGTIAISLNPVDGGTGESSTTFNSLDDGTVISYDDLLDFDGYINVHLSSDELSTLIAQGDIGQNQLTGNSKEYDLDAVAFDDISGSATFYERNNGEALAVIELENTPEDGEHPGHIHVNTAVEGGGIAFTFNPVNGNTGVSRTQVSQLNDGTSFGYDDVLEFDGYINIHLSPDELSTLVAQGDIGQNELTGESVSYELEERDVEGISGSAIFYERVNGTTLLNIALDGTPEDGIHPAHIHENDAETGGNIIVGLNPVDGTTGISRTQISELVGGEAVTYQDLLTIDAYINIHLSEDELSTIVAQGDIGSNANDEEEEEEEDVVNYDVTNEGASAYIFNDSGYTDETNPDLTLQRGQTYTFTMDTPGHPFFINSTQGTGTSNAYNEGVTNNGAVSGTITFTVPEDAADTLYYNCQFHSSMTGVINVTN